MEVDFEEKDIVLLRMLDIDMSDFSRSHNNSYLLNKPKEYYEELLDLISDKLMSEGLKEDDQPNDLGLKLEGLIDRISKVYYQ